MTLGLFYFGSLLGCIKLPSRPHTVRGPQVGKIWSCSITSLTFDELLRLRGIFLMAELFCYVDRIKDIQRAKDKTTMDGHFSLVFHQSG